VDKVAKSMAAVATTGTIPSFIIGTGDNFYWCGLENTTDPQIKADFITPYTNANLVQYPWYNVLGNHEYGYNVQAQLDLDLKGLVRNWNLPAR
jgi:tartrate-resistant acid phosphatase type 5